MSESESLSAAYIDLYKKDQKELDEIRKVMAKRFIEKCLKEWQIKPMGQAFGSFMTPKGGNG